MARTCSTHSGSLRTMMRHGHAVGTWSTDRKVSEYASLAKTTTGRGLRVSVSSPAVTVSWPESSVSLVMRAL